MLNKELTWNCCGQFMESLHAIDLEKIRSGLPFSLAFGGFLLHERNSCSLLLKKAEVFKNDDSLPPPPPFFFLGMLIEGGFSVGIRGK